MRKQSARERADAAASLCRVPHTVRSILYARASRYKPARADRAPPRGARDADARDGARAARKLRPRRRRRAAAAIPTATTATGRRHHTLTLAQGRALRRELSRHTLHALGGERVCEESSPETTLESPRGRRRWDDALLAYDGRGGRDGDDGGTRGRAADARRRWRTVERERRSTERRVEQALDRRAGANGEV